MPIDWEAIERAGGFGKGKPIADVRDERRKERQTKDEAESKKVKLRSGGRCEIFWELKTTAVRCDNPVMIGVHHMIGGSGKRARGESVKAERKQDVCKRCHDLITSKRLRRIGSEMPHYTDVYIRVR